jgi:UDP-N-acetylglucosamine diphosphorylase / glucose-1-phosphate thymidylyltransferase / UDP-N-acetylgalactosamine diphosphorylase / glucosamine-1-phosphate N-acetyltransferase / galactosamine-1-phosphate N-acetyltransferase
MTIGRLVRAGGARPTANGAKGSLPREPPCERPFRAAARLPPQESASGDGAQGVSCSAAMFRNRTVSLVVPAYNEEETIRQVVEEFRDEPHLDEIVVVDNNCKDRTAEFARDAGARVVAESTPGYGAALTAGMDAAKGEILVLVEADGSFRARDVVKLLVYLDDAGMVMGTRTTRQMVEQGANMRFLLRWGNVAMAKLLQLLWLRPSEPRFTDVGCTFRSLTRETWQRIRPRLKERGPAFSPEMMCAALQERCRIIEVPVTYSPRMGGESKHSDTFVRQAKTALKMFRTICRKRFLERSRPRAAART